MLSPVSTYPALRSEEAFWVIPMLNEMHNGGMHGRALMVMAPRLLNDLSIEVHLTLAVCIFGSNIFYYENNKICFDAR